VEHTFLFADLSGFTALTEVHGDEEAADLVTGFAEEVRAVLPDYGAEQVKTIGDAVMIRADDAERAVRLAIAIVHGVGRRHGVPAVRAGLHTGPAVERDGDWFGATVNLAARVSGAAAGGEVLVTGATAERISGDRGSPALHLQPRGRRELRNVAEPVELLEATCDFTRDLHGLPIDPVCRMAVDPGHAAGTLVHAGVKHCFCSLDCARRFAEAPEAYAG
jgi:class 3 adenylate cyclase/YHS domain-containing protein